MSLYDYKLSLTLLADDPTFAALIMAAMRKADTGNSVRLKNAFPDIWEELVARYNAPGGSLSIDGMRPQYVILDEIDLVTGDGVDHEPDPESRTSRD